ncbi:TPA: hypothetical protein DCW38_05525 [candidate division WOR-3 bacterium]|uniref:Cell wall-active antibiotics response LiaF-like C-terminal domain-containing protein n=1 Tax=candidate division WOR-3 bacterium TaxID=2052148 RepID=A0A350HAQ8_UNCW3|nr:hypothetical protein [candidate division WOR-3 bacterium]
MNCGLFSGVFWGFLLIILGILVILKNLLHLQIPVFKLIMGVFLVYLGISMLVGGFKKSTGKDIIFSSSEVTAESDVNEHNVIFGSGVIDFSNLELSDTVREYEINVIFSSAELIINPAVPVFIKTSAVFASSKLPDGKSVYFGKGEYNSMQDSAIKPIMIDANVVFGSLDAVNKSIVADSILGKEEPKIAE